MGNSADHNKNLQIWDPKTPKKAIDTIVYRNTTPFGIL